MKKIFLIISILQIAALLFISGLSCDEIKDNTLIKTLSLKDAVNIAFASNKDIQIQEQEIVYARANIMAAQGLFLPTVSVDASYTYTGTALQLASAATPGSRKDIGVFNGYQSDHRLSFSANEVVFNGGANIVNMKQARLGLKIQQETLRSRKCDVEFEVKRLYYGLLLAYETERIAEDLLNQAQEHYEDVKRKFNEGTSSRFDVLQSKVQVSKVMPELVKAKNNIEIIKAEFKKLLSIDMKNEITLKDNSLAYSYIDVRESEFLIKAYAGNPQMILRLMGIDMNRWSIEYAKSGYYPQVNANFNYFYRYYDPAKMFQYKHSNWSVGGTVSVPIFDAFSTTSKVNEAKAKYEQARLAKDDVRDQVAVDIKRACLDMNESRTIIDYEKDSIEEAREALKIANIGYDNGVKTNLEVLDSQVSLSQVEKSLMEGIYDYLMARAFLDKTMGTDFYKEESYGNKT